MQRVQLDESLIGRGAKYNGIVTSFNSQCVFVRYDGDHHSKATRINDIYVDSASEGMINHIC